MEGKTTARPGCGPGAGEETINQKTQSYNSKNNTLHQDPVTQLFDEVYDFGLSIESSASIVLDGKFHNVGTSENPRKKSGWYVGQMYNLGGRDFVLCTFGDFRLGSIQTFKSWDKKDRISKVDLDALKVKQDEQKKKVEQHLKRKRKQAAENAAKEWATLEASGSSQYLDKKDVQGHGVRYGESGSNPFIAIPVYSIDGTIKGLQKIFDRNIPGQDRNKTFTPGTEKKGGHFLIGKPVPFLPICIAEGYATAASIHEATGYPVVVCFDCGNIMAVVEAFRAKYPSQPLLIAADNDCWKDPDNNPGLKKATEAAKAFGCFLVIPDFTDLDVSDEPTDFNDLHLLAGKDAVSSQVQNCSSDYVKSQVTGVTGVTASNDAASSGNQSKNAEVTAVTEHWPGQDERPCYSVQRDWVEADGAKRKPGVYYHGLQSNGDSSPPTLIDNWICGPLFVRAITRDRNSFNFGRMLEFITSTKTRRCWAMPMALLAGSGEELRRELLSMGLEIDPKYRNQLCTYLQAIPPKMVLQSALNIGWHGDAFVLPDRTIGSDEIFFQSAHLEQREYTQIGTLDEWKQNIARLCAGNPLLVLAVSISFSGPLLRKLHTDGGGFHIYGDSSKGKSTGLRVASSSWGGDDYRKTWRATANGMEGVAAIFNDSFLAIDEISEAEGKEIGGIVYALANGVGKTRAQRDGTARPSHRWVVAVVSTGERTISSHMAEKGLQTKAGQEVRLLNIPIFGRHGSFDNLHEYDNGRQFSDALQTNCKKYYGTAGIEFLEKLCADQQDLGALLEQFLKAFDDGSLSSQEGRAAKRFAITALAGELATGYGVTGWEPQTALNGCVQCFKKWREEFGKGDKEDRQIIEAVLDFIDKHGDSRFSEPSSQEKIRDRAGYYRQGDDGNREYLFTSSGLHEALASHDFKRGVDALRKAKMLVPGKTGNQCQLKVNGRNTKVYRVRTEDGHE